MFDIGKVGQGSNDRVIETISVGQDKTMLDFNRGDVEIPNLERSGDLTGFRANVTWLLSLGGKCPGKHARKTCEGFTRTIKREGILASPAKGTEFIESSHVIEMLVRVENMIDLGDVFPERLLAKVGAGVDENIAPGPGEEGGRTSSGVTRVIRGADRAGTADYRDTNGGRGAQEKKSDGCSGATHRCIVGRAWHNPPVTAKTNAYSP